FGVPDHGVGGPRPPPAPGPGGGRASRVTTARSPLSRSAVGRAMRQGLAPFLAVMIAAGGGLAQTAPEPERYGLPAPDPRLASSLDGLLASLARSPDFVVAD